jgi:hypothetical protein
MNILRAQALKVSYQIFKKQKRLGLRPGPHWESSQRSSRPPSWRERGHPSRTSRRLKRLDPRAYGARVSHHYRSSC